MKHPSIAHAAIALACAILLLTTTLSARHAHAQTARAPERFALEMPDPERYVLENGLEVILDPLPGRREVTVQVTYHVGAADQRPGWTGLAHLAEHLMFEGSLHVPNDSYIPWLERAGSLDRNATTSLDRTEYHQTLPSERLETALFLESDRMAYLLSVLDEANVDEQRRIVARERIEHYALSAHGLLPGVTARALYPEGHPYREVDERPADLEAIRLAHVQWFVQSYYQPANATLIVSGGFEPASARAQIERWFGSIRRSGRVPPRVTPPRVRLEDETRIVVEADHTNDELRVVWPTPAYGAPGDAELDVVAHILEERLRLALVERGLAIGVWAYQLSRERGSEFTAGVVLPRDRGTAEALSAIDAELERMRGGVDPALVRRVDQVWFDRLVERMERTSARAQLLSMRWHDGTPYTVAADARRYAQVDAERTARAVRAFLPLDRRIVVSLDATPGVREGGRVVTTQRVQRSR
ncbi:M16 family metallopeptidase [Sandaracinus amylolyticus]|uniref:Zinc protease n=1 Tax=Sandaracinus amylolyticus TaxID=927083 RepID=A0A0F6YI76_9BACT|nr:pitrilysin family protein [Sandaracinus amylolyticus]AKF04785.1 Zinc protease [Sandaracinus amylolyticus]